MLVIKKSDCKPCAVFWRCMGPADLSCEKMSYIIWWRDDSNTCNYCYY